MGAHDGAVEHLDQMRRFAGFSQRLEKCLEHAASAQARKPLPNAVPLAELRRQSPPRHVVDREIMQRLQEFAVVPSFVPPPRPARAEQLDSEVPFVLCHPRQHRRLPKTKPTAYESPIPCFRNPPNQFVAIRPHGLAPVLRTASTNISLRRSVRLPRVHRTLASPDVCAPSGQRKCHSRVAPLSLRVIGVPVVAPPEIRGRDGDAEIQRLHLMPPA